MMNKLHMLRIFSLLVLAITFVSSVDKRQLLAYKPGHVIFGGLFPAHLGRLRTLRENCAEIDMKGIALIEAMMYAVNKINSDHLLPCNLTLGFDVRDTCDTKKNALKHTLSFLSGERYSSINEDLNSCGREKTSLCDGKLISIIGAGNTELSVAVNKVLSVFDIPQVGYASTSGILSDKSRFPSFSRTVVIGSNKPQVIVNILTHFEWEHIGLLVSDDVHWKALALEFKNLASSEEICIDMDELISDDSKTIETVVDQVNSANNTHVFVLFASFYDAKNVFQKASDMNVKGKLWISSEMLPPDVANEYGNTLQGMIAIEREPESVDGFAEYFTTLNPTKNTWNPWFKILWEKLFSCRLSKNAENGDGENNRTCSGKENFKWVGHYLSFSHAIHVIDAVMAASHVIRDICHEIEGKNATDARDQCLKKLTKENVLKEMFKGPFSFKSLFNKTASLDKNGNAVGSYVIFHLKQDYNGIRFQRAGVYKSDKDKLIINKSVITWPRDFPLDEICRTYCGPGFHKDYEGSKCCWKCKACPFGTISKVTNSKKCVACPEDSTPNAKRTTCEKKAPKYFDWGSSGGVTLTIISLTSFFFSLIVFCVIIKFRSSPVVSGWGSSVNFYLIWSISIGVLIPFVFIGYPTGVMCKLQVVTVATTLTLSLSLVMVKIRQITCKKKNMISRWRVLSYAQKQTIYALFFVILQIMFCILWIVVNPPSVKVVYNQEKFILCSSQNASWYVLSFSYIIAISFFITLKSCKSRNRSFNFSEAKYVLYAMFCIYITWGVYIAIFIATSSGFHQITLLCLTSTATQMLLLCFLFLPKIFILLFRPEMAKLCEFQMDDTYAKDQSYEASNLRHHHPANGIIRSNSPSLREDSSLRGTPSQMSLDNGPSSHPQVRTQNTLPKNPSVVERMLQLPCCAAGLQDDESSVVSEQHQRNYHLSPLAPRPPPLIMIDEGTRSNSPRSQISDRTFSPRSPITDRTFFPRSPISDRTFSPNPTRRNRPKIIEDHDQECLSATMDNTEVWSKRRRSSSNSRPSQALNNEEYCLRFALKGNIIENKHFKQHHNASNNPLRESRL